MHTNSKICTGTDVYVSAGISVCQVVFNVLSQVMVQLYVCACVAGNNIFPENNK